MQIYAYLIRRSLICMNKCYFFLNTKKKTCKNISNPLAKTDCDIYRRCLKGCYERLIPANGSCHRDFVCQRNFKIDITVDIKICVSPLSGTD